MFEQSLVVSQQSTVSSEERWTAFISLFLQVAAVGALIALPMLHPDRLASHVDSPHVKLPSLRMPKPVVVKMQRTTNSVSTATVAPKLGVPLVVLPVIPTTVNLQPDTEPQIAIREVGMPTGIPEGVTVAASSPNVRIAAANTTPGNKVKVSEGVSAGMLLAPIRPLYPPIAKAAGVQGVVVIEAVISKSGTIESLHVVSGPEMLRRAAVEAIQSARYKPYRLNGEPTEVQTTITLNFKISS